MDNKGTTNSTVVSRRERTDEQEEQNGAKGEEKVGDISEYMVELIGEQEEGQWPPSEGRLPPGIPDAPPQGARLDYPRYQAVRTDEGADLERVVPSEADCQLVHMYGNYIHQNESCHMNRGIIDNNIWQVPDGIKVPCPSRGRRPAVREVSGRRIPWGKRAMLECRNPRGIHGGDPVDGTERTQVPHDLPQDYVVPVSMVYCLV